MQHLFELVYEFMNDTMHDVGLTHGERYRLILQRSSFLFCS